MKTLFLRGFLVLGGIFVFTGCQKSEGPIVARVGGTAISLTDFTNRLRDTPVAYQQYVATPEGRRQFLNLLIREKVLLAKARKAGLQNQPDYRKSVQQYKERIERQKKDYSESLLIESYINQLRSKDLAVSDAEVRNYYDAHAANYSRPTEIQANHILVNTEPEAQRVLVRLKAGESFEALARAISMDPSTAAQGGKLTPYIRGTLMPAFEEAVNRLKVGQLSGVVKTSFGYHIIKKTGEKQLPARSFDQAKEDIRNHLQRDKFDEWITREQKSLGVKLDEKALATVNMSPSPIPGSLSQEPAQ